MKRHQSPSYGRRSAIAFAFGLALFTPPASAQNCTPPCQAPLVCRLRGPGGSLMDPPPGTPSTVRGVCVCPRGKVQCGAGCVDYATFQSDTQNCGACHHACGANASCVKGVCVCPQGKVQCGTGCVDSGFQSDAKNCGACQHACGATENCVKGQCVLDCHGLTNCGGKCIDSSSDGHNCGSCNNDCSGPNWVKTTGKCISGQCQCAFKAGCGQINAPPSCPAGKTACAEGNIPGCYGASCVNYVCRSLSDDNNNCGSCGAICGTTGGRYCNGGTCRCDRNKLWCHGACIDQNRDNCGACDQVCTGGNDYCDTSGASSKCTCAPGEKICGGVCTNTTASHDNCGSCGNVCGKTTVYGVNGFETRYLQCVNGNCQ